MKIVTIILIVLLGLVSKVQAQQIGEAQVVRVSKNKKKGILKVSEFSARSGKIAYLTSGVSKKLIAVKVVKVKKNFAIVKAVKGRLRKGILYEIHNKRPKKRRRKKAKQVVQREIEEEQEQEEEYDSEPVDSSSGKFKHHNLSFGLGLFNPSGLTREGVEDTDGDYSGHNGFSLKYKYRSQNGFAGMFEYMTVSGKYTSGDSETSSSFGIMKFGLLYYMGKKFHVNTGLSIHAHLLSSEFVDLTYSGKGLYFGAGYDSYITEKWFWSFDFTYHPLSYSKETEEDSDDQTENSLSDTGHTAMSFFLSIGYGF